MDTWLFIGLMLLATGFIIADRPDVAICVIGFAIAVNGQHSVNAHKKNGE